MQLLSADEHTSNTNAIMLIDVVQSWKTITKYVNRQQTTVSESDLDEHVISELYLLLQV